MNEFYFESVLSVLNSSCKTRRTLFKESEINEWKVYFDLVRKFIDR